MSEIQLAVQEYKSRPSCVFFLANIGLFNLNVEEAVLWMCLITDKFILVTSIDSLFT
jgi:hypothetical protein